MNTIQLSPQGTQLLELLHELTKIEKNELIEQSLALYVKEVQKKIQEETK